MNKARSMKFFNILNHDREFAMIDICKFIMAFVVIAIHTNPVVNCTDHLVVRGVVIIEEWAVPFFFIASGFFLFYNKEYYDSLQKQRIDKYLKKIIVLYCVWTLLSFPLTLYGYIQSDNSLIECVFSYIKYFLFVGKLYNSYHLWYLLALIYAVAMIRFMLKRKCKMGQMVIVSVLLYSINEFLQYIINHLQNSSSMMYKVAALYQYVFNNGGVFTGMIYVVIGMVIAKHRKYLNRWICISAIVILNILKLYCNPIVVDYLEIIETTLVFMVIISIEIKDNMKYKFLRKASTIIYLSHLIWYSVYTFIIIKEPNKLGLDSFAVTSILSFVNAVILIGLMKNRKLEWIKKIT